MVDLCVKYFYAAKCLLNFIFVFNSIFSTFRDDHVNMGFSVVRLIFNKFAETNDVSDVLDYADSLQRSYQVNHHVVHWAVEIFIVHCKAAKKLGIL